MAAADNCGENGAEIRLRQRRRAVHECANDCWPAHVSECQLSAMSGPPTSPSSCFPSRRRCLSAARCGCLDDWSEWNDVTGRPDGQRGLVTAAAAAGCVTAESDSC